MIAGVLAAVLSLGDVESAAIGHAPAVTEARARISEQQALLDAARGSGRPSAFATYAQSPQAGTVGTVTQRLTTVGGQVVLGDVAARDPLIAQASAALRGAIASESNAERHERTKSIGLYIDAIRTREVRTLRETIFNAAKADRHAAELRFQTGDVPRLDVVRADVEVARSQADLAQARADETNALRTLAIEIGSDPATLVLPALAQIATPVTEPPTLDAAVSAALVRRPEIAAARADVRAEEAALRAAHRGVLPALTVQAGYTTGVDTGIRVSGPSGNVTLNVPLSNAASGRARAESARLAQAQARAAAATQTVSVEVSTAYESLRAQREAVAASASARSEAQAEVRAAQAGYREGASSSLDLADARRTYAQAAVADAIARAALTQAALTFGLALGEEGP